MFSLRITCSILLFAVIISTDVAGAGSKGASGEAVATAVEHFREFYLAENSGFGLQDTNEAPPDPQSARAYADSLGADGSWANIDYRSAALSDWPPVAHYTRMTAMVTSAMKAGRSDVERAELLKAAHRAFAYWIAHDFQSTNWWYNEIGSPKVIGQCALLLGKELTPAEFIYVTETLLARYPIKLTGQNRVWLAGNALMRGLLKGDEALIAEAVNTIWAEIQISTGEGLQPDASFHQHGAQQQFGNYGMSFASEIGRWAVMLRETPWQLSDGKRQILRDFLLQGQNWVSWRGAMDISACGRQLMPHSPRAKAAVVGHVMALAEIFDADFASSYRAYIERNRLLAHNDLIGTRYFWRSDYLIHRRPDFAATLKFSSTRVVGAESMNGENLSGYHTADGCLLLYRAGDEYQDIFPVWDWKKLPGITCAQDALPEFLNSSVSSDSAGGISRENTGLAALDFKRDGIAVKKAWFFHNDEIVCLGADLAGSSSNGIATTINQCLLRGPVLEETGTGLKAVQPGRESLKNPKAIEHDGWRYELLDCDGIQLETGLRTGNWRKVFDNPATPLGDVTQSVFMLWLDHGAVVAGGHYAYRIAPVKTPESGRTLENSGSRQVVQWADGTAAIVFWRAGQFTFPTGEQLEVSAPCLVLMTEREVLVTDPTQKLDGLDLVFGSERHAVNFPVGGFAGTPVAIERTSRKSP